MPIALVWFRNDLRLDDNPALRAAVEGGYQPLMVYIHAPAEEGEWPPGAASDAWRHRSLKALDDRLRARGSVLRCFHGPTQATLESIAVAVDAEAVFWNRRYEPAVEARDTIIKGALRRAGLRAESFNGSLLFEPWEVETAQGDPYRVFTPFWKRARGQWRTPRLWQAPDHFEAPEDDDAVPHGVPLEGLHLAPRRGWDHGCWERFTPGEEGAEDALSRFLQASLADYPRARDLPAVEGTSRLSPHLHFGEISVVRVAQAVIDAGMGEAGDVCLAQLGWREFAHHLLHHYPHTVDADLDPRFADFPWARPQHGVLAAWQRGRTGVPIVDAGMRELWQTGWMHNRVRMLAASYLTKHLRVHWRHGARWFWDTLVDADLANNTMGWQWVAGTGADAAPYFRVFNPVLQARRFDPDAAYISRWIPELDVLPPAHRFAPWEAPDPLLKQLRGYPHQPVVGMAEGRQAALAAYAQVRRKAEPTN
ncbi:deoxyribodipyrimidine photo-lyase [Luteimonas yindakuii]|uniref:Deoxyribodipyrimidine photo-lyase n=1 Tax=Luteimonas yindakuii TaxID=2565782 RepID=A0A4Z1RD19_9GAMM|nr:deoxyribodipyrimidine photo-lyase [Luteimonas yindakuii]TKS54053.1 deoxyribodipyrimidine photo-lyase [Luteimonas yindakuii]